MKYFFLTVIICIGSLSLSAQDTTANAGTAKVYIIRSTGFGGSAVKFRAWVNDSLICKLPNNYYSIHTIAPGSYTFHATSFDKYKMQENGFEIQLEAGKTYYFKIAIKKRAFDSYIYLQEITENSAAPLIEKCKKEVECKVKVEMD